MYINTTMGFFSSAKHHLAFELTNEMTKDISWIKPNGFLYWNCYLSLRVALLFTKIPKKIYSNI
jgi:hypothetical protein